MEKINIRIYRGANQIGGCATEISYGEERILIDLGANLPGTEEEGSISDEEVVSKVFDGRPCKAVLFTHYHGDHYGLYKEIPETVPMYIGSTAKEIVKIVTDTLSVFHGQSDVKTIDKMHTFVHMAPIFSEGNIQVTPILTDHSAIDAYMFLVEILGKKILFTGDFRDHGIASENDNFWKTIRECVPENIDVLITEGTMITREMEAKQNIVHTEAELGVKAKEYFKEKKYNYALVSSTNLDTIMEFYRNTTRGKMFIIDGYQAKVMLTAMKLRKDLFDKYCAYEYSEKERCKEIYIIGKRNLQDSNKVYVKNMDELRELAAEVHPDLHLGYAFYERMRNKGFVMLVRANRQQDKYKNSFEETMEEFVGSDSQMIYSMWKGYLKGEKQDADVVELVKRFGEPRMLHTSGHAYVETIAELIRVVNPGKIIPMHTEFAEGFKKSEVFADYRDRIETLNDLTHNQISISVI